MNCQGNCFGDSMGTNQLALQLAGCSFMELSPPPFPGEENARFVFNDESYVYLSLSSVFLSAPPLP